MIVRISGFGEGVDISLPAYLRNPQHNTRKVVLALVRWLSPHPHATSRDFKHRPVCPAPFDINHALWTFARLDRERLVFRQGHHVSQLDLFPGSDRGTRLTAARTHSRAMYDFVQLESIEHFINCTTIDDDETCILESLTLPF